MRLIGLVLLFIVGAGLALTTEPSILIENSSHHWDILIFTQHWPNTVCIQWKEKLENHTCLLSQEWAVHGVWPTKLGTIGPGFCNNSWHFDPEALSPIQSKLDVYWPNIENGTAEDSLWKHEWQKHGTCAAQLPSLDSEIKYFTQGLQWIFEHGMTNSLQKAGIYPSATKTYTVQRISDAVKNAVNINPGIECLHDAKTGNTYLFEIRICFDKTLKLVDCDGIKVNGGEVSKLITNCPLDEPIYYPNVVPGQEDAPPKQHGIRWVKTIFVFLNWLQWLTF